MPESGEFAYGVGAGRERRSAVLRTAAYCRVPEFTESFAARIRGVPRGMADGRPRGRPGSGGGAVRGRGRGAAGESARAAVAAAARPGADLPSE